MFECKACGRSYGYKDSLKKHYARQPLCEKWLDNKKLNTKVVEYVNEHWSEEKEHQTNCQICNKSFSNIGNLNRHMNENVICKKWEKYYNIESIYEEFIAPKYKLNHIIWNVFLIDKELELTDEIIKENNIGYIIALLPDEKVYYEKVKVNVPHTIMTYEGHNPILDVEKFDIECNKIEEYRKERKNIFVFCNNGYQRSIPFLCHYLTKFHNDEVPTIEKAIDIILPQVDKDNYSTLRNKYIENMELLFN